MHLSPNPREVVTTKALVVWLASLAVYIVAVAGRTSFGVASVDAMDRFAVNSAAIAVFTSIQVGTYALAQIPTGVAIDKFGPRAMLITGALVMGIGQILLGFTHVYGVAIAARVLIGAGDATAFLAVMRILPYWFPMHRAPMFTQVTAMAGQLGQFISAFPFMWLLGFAGWQFSFISLGAAGVLIAVLASLAVADAPAGAVPAAAQPLRSRLSLVVRSATVWNAFFIHFCGMLTVIMFALMWGVPLMTQAMGLSGAQAGTVLTLTSVALLVVGPLHGKLSARMSGYRDWATLVFIGLQLAGWIWFFWSPNPRGFLAISVMAVIMAATQPVSNYGFDMIRERLPGNVVATATGLANMGGFIAGMLGAQLMGLLLADSLEWGAFRHAAGYCALLWVISVTGIIITHFFKAPVRRVKPQVVG
ncbi:MFS transporter permease [Corynebacterium phocae]|uniref:MFS transporter permease n=1 Tax=Corynebacterium phocae TaxID=161895 RepID=A0A1L7D6A9_9CORY|nr:MFS transporter permease [Corynebacterium phocae]